MSALAELTDSLVAVHGQAEAISLLRPGRARSLLDRFAGPRRTRRDLPIGPRGVADRAVATSPTAPGAPGSGRNANSCCADPSRRSTRVAPLPGEDADLVAEVRRLDDADALRAAAAEAAVALTGSDVDDVPNVAALLQAAQRTLSGARRIRCWPAGSTTCAAPRPWWPTSSPT